MVVRAPVKELRRQIVGRQLEKEIFQRTIDRKSQNQDHLDTILKYPKAITGLGFFSQTSYGSSRLLELLRKDPERFGKLIGPKARRFGYGLGLNLGTAQHFFEHAKDLDLFFKGLGNNIGEFMFGLQGNQMAIFGRAVYEKIGDAGESKGLKSDYGNKSYFISKGIGHNAELFGKFLDPKQMGSFFKKYIGENTFMNFIRGFGNNLDSFLRGLGEQKLKIFINELGVPTRLRYAQELKLDGQFSVDIIKILTGVDSETMRLIPI